MLLIICLATMGYGIFGFVTYALEIKRDESILAKLTLNLIDFTSFKNSHTPQPLVMSAPQIIYNQGTKYDFAAQVKNPNKDRGVKELTFQFVAPGLVTPTSSVIILPQQTVYLLSLGVSSQKRLNKAELKIIKITWENLWKKEQLPWVEITTTEPKFNVTPGGDHAWVNFSATNNSLKNIWEVNWQAVLYSGKRMVGANQITTEEFLSGATRQIDISWFEKLPKVTQIDVIPIINIYDPDSFYSTPGQAEALY